MNRLHLERFAGIAALLLWTAACSHARPEPAPPPSRVVAGPIRSADIDYVKSRRLMVPVSGVAVNRVPDTFNEKRGDRRHNATDLRAPRGTPVLSADEGHIFSIRSNELGGLVIFATDPKGRLVYYYAHLDRFAPKIFEGMKLAKGDVIGYVGTTGNAPAHVPHLHFQVMRADSDKKYWDGTPIDPRPLFAKDGHPR